MTAARLILQVGEEALLGPGGEGEAPRRPALGVGHEEAGARRHQQRADRGALVGSRLVQRGLALLIVSDVWTSALVLRYTHQVMITSTIIAMALAISKINARKITNLFKMKCCSCLGQVVHLDHARVKRPHELDQDELGLTKI